MLQTLIVDHERELMVRQTAASHLRGIAAMQNASSIDALYDALNHLHIEQLEAAAPALCIYCSRNPQEPGSDYCFDSSCAILASEG